MPLNILPFPPQSMNSTERGMRENFNSIDAAFQVNHFGYDVLNTGLHSKVDFPETIAVPDITALTMALFTRKSADGKTAEMAISKKPVATTLTVNFTEALRYGIGWTYLPSGILIQWGFGGTQTDGTAEVAFPKEFSAVPYNVEVTGANSGVNPRTEFYLPNVTGTPTTKKFNVLASKLRGFGGSTAEMSVGRTLFKWVAIGV